MTSFDAYGLIALWERGAAVSAAEKAALLLQLIHPDRPREDLGAVTIGQRDRLLLELRRQLFGDELEGLATCSRCEERLEIDLRVSDFLADAPAAPPEPYASIVVDGVDVIFRLPNNDDAIAVAKIGNCELGNRLLVQSCIVSATRDGESVDPKNLPSQVIDRVSRHMEILDPLSEIRLNLACSACEHTEFVLLDIATYLWAELVWEAERLLDEVSFLARQYGWRESDILAMSGRRRQFYLDRSPA